MTGGTRMPANYLMFVEIIAVVLIPFDRGRIVEQRHEDGGEDTE